VGRPGSVRSMTLRASPSLRPCSPSTQMASGTPRTDRTAPGPHEQQVTGPDQSSSLVLFCKTYFTLVSLRARFPRRGHGQSPRNPGALKSEEYCFVLSLFNVLFFVVTDCCDKGKSQCACLVNTSLETCGSSSGVHKVIINVLMSPRPELQTHSLHIPLVSLYCHFREQT